MECMAADIYVAQGLGDFWHVTCDAIAARAVRRVMRMRRDGRRVRAVAVKAKAAGRLAQVGGQIQPLKH